MKNINIFFNFYSYFLLIIFKIIGLKMARLSSNLFLHFGPFLDQKLLKKIFH